ncbi:vesicle-associated protein 4-2 [Senna tora]|uniref:Vesicle-associated protein 4-2 n=1 Tax=Senna tora TaxID=362788 RepID=A0A835CF54_9FABA|nr:vesicle-associated protein 4-2 [Senna tora]
MAVEEYHGAKGINDWKNIMEPRQFCFMRSPGVSLRLMKFIEQLENNEKPEKSGLKFKIMSLKVKGAIDYVPELLSCLMNKKNQIIVEQILRVVFLDPEHPIPIFKF